jgi:hypothetical protein
LFYLLELLLHGGVDGVLVALQVADDVVLFGGEFLLYAAELLQALAFAVEEVGLPGLAIGEEGLFGDGAVDLLGGDRFALSMQWSEGVFTVLTSAVGQIGLESWMIAAHFIFIYQLMLFN